MLMGTTPSPVSLTGESTLKSSLRLSFGGQYAGGEGIYILVDNRMLKASGYITCYANK